MFPLWPERDQGRSEAQGITAADLTGLGELVRLSAWSETCYAFAHSTDDELADGIMQPCTSLSTAGPGTSSWRRWPTGEDIKRVWRSGRGTS